MKTLAFILVISAAGVAQAQSRPTLAAAVGYGVDFEPQRTLPNAGSVSSTLGSYEFEGEILWRELGLIARGVGTDGSIDYDAVGFDRLELIGGGSWRPLARRVLGTRWIDIVARRLSMEAGLSYQQITAGLSSTHLWGLHLGAHADFPLFARDAGTTPFIRLIAQRAFLIDTGDKVNVLVRPCQGMCLVEPGTPPLQILFAFGVAW
jgi:hypothetical protein